MKKALLTLAVVGLTVASYAQGTVAFVNTATSAVKLVVPGTSTVSVPTTAGLINYGLFWGTSSDNLALAPALGANSTSNAGIIAGNASLTYVINGAQELTTYWMQVKGWDASFGSDWQLASTKGNWFGQTDIRQVTTAANLGPGTAIWQSATGTNPNRFYALQLTPVPEPTTFALAGLAGAALLIFRRRK